MKLLRKRSLLLLAIAATVLSLIGCGKSEDAAMKKESAVTMQGRKQKQGDN